MFHSPTRSDLVGLLNDPEQGHNRHDVLCAAADVVVGAAWDDHTRSDELVAHADHAAARELAGCGGREGRMHVRVRREVEVAVSTLPPDWIASGVHAKIVVVSAALLPQPELGMRLAILDDEIPAFRSDVAVQAQSKRCGKQANAGGKFSLWGHSKLCGANILIILEFSLSF